MNSDCEIKTVPYPGFCRQTNSLMCTVVWSVAGGERVAKATHPDRFCPGVLLGSWQHSSQCLLRPALYERVDSGQLSSYKRCMLLHVMVGLKWQNSISISSFMSGNLRDPCPFIRFSLFLQCCALLIIHRNYVLTDEDDSVIRFFLVCLFTCQRLHSRTTWAFPGHQIYSRILISNCSFACADKKSMFWIRRCSHIKKVKTNS